MQVIISLIPVQPTYKSRHPDFPTVTIKFQSGRDRDLYTVPHKPQSSSTNLYRSL